MEIREIIIGIQNQNLHDFGVQKVKKFQGFRVTGVLMDVSFLGVSTSSKMRAYYVEERKEKKSGFLLLFPMVLVYKEKMDNKKYRIDSGKNSRIPP